MAKATLEQLNSLHGLVAEQLAKQVKEGDLKAIEKAISFLKNNNISATIVESQETKSLFTSIKEQIKDTKRSSVSSVEDILAMYE